MATQKYMYLNNGKKVPVYGNTNTHSMPYRTYVTETVPDNTGMSTKKTSAGRQTVTASEDDGAAKLAEEMRKKREAEQAKAAEEVRRRQERINAINANRDRERKLIGENFEAQKKAAGLTNRDNLRQLYIAYMQGLQGVPQKTAMWGAGGEIESLKNRSRLNYESGRAQENRNYAGILGDIQQKYNDDLNELERKYLQQLLNV